MYKLLYFQNEMLVETVLHSAPIGVCHWKKAMLQESTHKLGKFKIEKT